MMMRGDICVTDEQLQGSSPESTERQLRGRDFFEDGKRDFDKNDRGEAKKGVVRRIKTNEAAAEKASEKESSRGKLNAIL